MGIIETIVYNISHYVLMTTVIYVGTRPAGTQQKDYETPQRGRGRGREGEREGGREGDGRTDLKCVRVEFGRFC